MKSRPSSAVRPIIDSLSGVAESLGLLICIYLYLADRFAVQVRCFGSSGCDRLAASLPRAISWLPIPIIGIASLSVALVINIASMTFRKRSHQLERLHYLVALGGSIISLTLTLFGLVSARTMCPWCLGVLVCTAASASLSKWHLSQKICPKPDTAYYSLTAMSLAITAGVVIYFKLQDMTLSSQIMPEELREFNLRDVAGDIFAKRASEVTIPTFVAFYSPGCGGCIHSMQFVGGQYGPKDLSCFEPRIICEPGSTSFSGICSLQAVVNRCQDRVTRKALKFFTTMEEPYSLEVVSSFLRDNNIDLPTVAEYSNASRYVLQTTAVVKKLGIQGFPLLLHYTNNMVGYEVNRLTLE